MVKCLPEFEYFYCVLENLNIIFKIRRSKVTDYAALIVLIASLTLSPPISFVLKISSAFYVCCIYSSSLQTRFYHEGKYYGPRSDCFLEQSDLGPWCLQHRLPKNLSRRDEQPTKIVTVRNT